MNKELTVIQGAVSAKEFSNLLKEGKPVLLKGAIKDWKACKTWDLSYFKELPNDKLFVVKGADLIDGETTKMKLKEYVSHLEKFIEGKSGKDRPPYLHDVGMFNIIPELVNDVSSEYIKEYLPKFYHKNWWKYVQFFMSVKGHVTPLHFDTLMTHNLFFQVKGTKRFTLIPWNQKDACYMKKWRWSEVDPNNPDFKRFEKYADVAPVVVDVEGGDILLMPTGTLHHVESTSFCISFNIDWHSKSSVLKGMYSYFQGAPKQNFMYNFYMFLAIWIKVPEKYIWSYYKSYLSYIS